MIAKLLLILYFLYCSFPKTNVVWLIYLVDMVLHKMKSLVSLSFPFTFH